MGRAPCCEKEGLKKGPWTSEEDQKLIDYIQQHGHRNWRTLPKNAGLQRCGKSCRLRWTNYLRPDIKRGRFSFEEEQTIIHLHSILGNKWSAIAARLPGRTDNEIKNYWNTHIRKLLLRNGIDPVTHATRLDLLDLSSILNSSPNSYANISRLIGLQQLVNPEILKLAASLFSNSSTTTTTTDCQFSMQNQQLVNPIPTDSQLIQTTQLQQLQPQLTNIPQGTCTNSTPCMTIASFEAHNSLDGSNNFDPLYSLSNMIDLGFDAQSFELQTQGLSSQLMNAWQDNGRTTNNDEHLPDLSNLDFIQQNGCEASYINGLYDSDNSTFQSDNPSFSFNSILSTPSSLSPTPLNSNSNSMGITTEDERESYSSTLIMKFEIPADHYLDVNEFM